MNKHLLYSAAILSCCVLTGCGNEETQKEETKDNQEVAASEAKVDTQTLLSDAKKAIDNQKFYQAKDKLEKVLEEEKDNTTAKSLLDQINNYQQAKDKLADKKYEDAKQLVEKIKKQTNGSVKMNDYTNNLMKEISDKQKEEKKSEQKTEDKKQEATTNKQSSSKASASSNYASMAQNLSDEDKIDLNKAMMSWCETQAKKGGMATSVEGMGTPRYATDDDYSIQTPNGSFNIREEVIGFDTFYTPAGEDTWTKGGYGIRDAQFGTVIDRYVWCNDGNVYEQKSTYTKNNQDVARLEYSLTENTTFKVSEDKAAIAEYHRLLEKYTGNGNTSGTKSSIKVNRGDSQNVWSTEKESALADMMSSWSSEMGQDYVSADLNSSDNTVITKNGLSLVNASDYQPVRGLAILKINGQEQTVSVGDSDSGYQIVGAYSGVSGEGKEGSYVYLFTLNNGKPKVLFCDINKNIDSSTGKAYANFKSTSNQQLQQQFEEITK